MIVLFPGSEAKKANKRRGSQCQETFFFLFSLKVCDSRGTFAILFSSLICELVSGLDSNTNKLCVNKNNCMVMASGIGNNVCLGLRG